MILQESLKFFQLEVLSCLIRYFEVSYFGVFYCALETQYHNDLIGRYRTKRTCSGNAALVPFRPYLTSPFDFGHLAPEVSDFIPFK
jgi:hypothetical protein